MKQILKFTGALMLIVFAIGCETTSSHTDLLSAAGFKVLAADTPKKQELLATLPKDQLSLIKGLNLRLISIGAVKVDGDSAIVRATIATGGQRTTRRFQLAKEDGSWKLVGGS